MTINFRLDETYRLENYRVLSQLTLNFSNIFLDSGSIYISSQKKFHFLSVKIQHYIFICI